jgi:hypothetical protein
MRSGWQGEDFLNVQRRNFSIEIVFNPPNLLPQ